MCYGDNQLLYSTLRTSLVRAMHSTDPAQSVMKDGNETVCDCIEFPPSVVLVPSFALSTPSKSDFAPLSAYQGLTASFLVGVGAAKGCFWNQDVEALARGAGLRVQSSQPALPGGVFRSLECVPRVGS